MTGLRRALHGLVRACLGLAALCLAPVPAAAEDQRTAGPGLDWIQSPYRHFRDGQALAAGRAVLYDEADDAAFRAQLDAELARLSDELYVRQGWRSPFSDGEPVRVYVARGAAGNVAALTSRDTENGRLVAPAVLVDASGLSTPELVRAVSRQITLATLAGYGAAPDAFLLPALAESLATPAGAPPSAEAWSLAAAGQLDFRAHPEALGRLWVEEAALGAGGRSALREAWERAAATGEPPTAVLLRALADEPGFSEEGILARSAARLYTAIEAEPSPSRLRLLDVESGALDAAAPGSFSVRHRSLLPDTEETLRLSWPQDGGAAAAIVRYRDPELPPDVVFLAAGERHAIALSGVARVDWIVAGSASGGRGVAAPVSADLSSAVPYSGLDARAEAAAAGPRLTWTTESHDGLWGWAVFREEVEPDGRVVRSGPQIVPSAQSSAVSYRYAFVDSSVRAATYYRYTVWAVTAEGTLSRAFSATLKSAD